jgi:putative hydrolase of the HAD superfamily
VSRTRAVLLDLYDTLAWTEWKAVRALLTERTGVEPRRLMTAFHRTRPMRSTGAFGSIEGDLRAVLNDAGVAPNDDELRELVRLEREILAEGVHLWDDVLPTIADLRGRGLGVAVVSNCDHATRRVVDDLGLEDAVDAMILSFEVRVAKPDPGIYRAALDALGGVRPEEAMFVDDQTGYLDGASALGIRSVLIVRDGVTPVEGVADPADYPVIRDLRELPSLL